MLDLKLNFKLLILVTLGLVFFSSCDSIIENIEEDFHESLNPEITRTIAAVAQSQSYENECDCYALFDDVDFDAEDVEISIAIHSILCELSPEEMDNLFEPVCTEDGTIVPSTCIAECNNLTTADCETDVLGLDYLWEGVDCPPRVDFPIEVFYDDGTNATINSYSELYDSLSDFYLN